MDAAGQRDDADRHLAGASSPFDVRTADGDVVDPGHRLDPRPTRRHRRDDDRRADDDRD